jgi:competence protein ComEA
MSTDNKPFLKWFGYSRRERRSTFILFMVLIIVVIFHYVVPQKEIEIENLSGLLALADNGKDSFLSSVSDTTHLFLFDPNFASRDTLSLLGFSDKQARNIISYRNKGGRFRQPSDIKKIYGIDEATAARIIPYIFIKKDEISPAIKHSGNIADKKKTEKVDLNRADSALLERLPGIGPVLSSRIIKYRKLLGGFFSAEQLNEVYGLPETTYNLLAGRVFADSLLITRINLNDAGFTELSRHPYLNRYDIQAILKYKELKGRISDISELVENKVLSAVKANKIAHYLKF